MALEAGWRRRVGGWVWVVQATQEAAEAKEQREESEASIVEGEEIRLDVASDIFPHCKGR